MTDNNKITISAEGIKNGGMKSFKQDDDSIILITRDGDEFNAFDGKCTHAGADLGEGLRCGNRVICPWHHGTFDSTDGSLIEPVAMKGLTRYSVCLLYTSPSPRDKRQSRMPSSA